MIEFRYVYVCAAAPYIYTQYVCTYMFVNNWDKIRLKKNLKCDTNNNYCINVFYENVWVQHIDWLFQKWIKIESEQVLPFFAEFRGLQPIRMCLRLFFSCTTQQIRCVLQNRGHTSSLAIMSQWQIFLRTLIIFYETNKWYLPMCMDEIRNFQRQIFMSDN